MDKLSMNKFSFPLDNSDNPCEKYHTKFGGDHSTKTKRLEDHWLDRGWT